MEFPVESMQKLRAATIWLQNLTDPKSGRVPNYGNNDGAYIFPLTSADFHDFRPVTSACAGFFLGKKTHDSENEMEIWFKWLAGLQDGQILPFLETSPINSYQKVMVDRTAGYLFTPHYRSRPGQADVLHVDLYRDGNPLTLDPGTYSYNSAPPWDNALSRTKFHNTITVHEEDQMQKAGRFLWLDWPQIKFEGQNDQKNSLTAFHNGYRKFGIIHKRQLSVITEDIWRVYDSIEISHRIAPIPVYIWLHWLLPDRNWKVLENGLRIENDSPRYKVLVTTQNIPQGQDEKLEFQFIRGGILQETNFNSQETAGSLENFGWYSPTYWEKIPVFSFRVRFKVNSNINIYTEFQFG